MKKPYKRKARPMHTPPIPRDVEHLRTLALIPPNIYRKMDPATRPGSVTRTQIRAIKKILCLRGDYLQRSFNRCRYKSLERMKEFEAKNDFSHSDRGHVCEKCRCRNVAGKNTKGDFYGLGWETGMLGVGPCAESWRSHRLEPGPVLIQARREVELMQLYGSLDMDTEYALTVTKEEALMARQGVKAREEYNASCETLARLHKGLQEMDEDRRKTQDALQAIADWLRAARGENSDIVRDLAERIDDAMVANTSLTEYQQGKLVPMSGKSTLELMSKLASALSKIRKDGFAMDATKYLLIDHALIAGQQIEQDVAWAVRKTEELVTAKAVRGEKIETDRPISDYVLDMFKERWAATWRQLQAKVGKG